MAFAMLMLLTVGFAQAQQPVFTVDASILNISLALLIIMSSLLAIGFMASRVFGITAFEAWIREEYAELIFTAVLLVMFSVLATMVETIADQLANDTLFVSASAGSQNTYWAYNQDTGRWSPGTKACAQPCQFYIARAFLGSLYETYYKQIMSVGRFYSESKMWESFVPGSEADQIFGMIDLEFSIPLYAQRAVFNNSLELVIDVLLKALLSVKTQEFLLFYLSYLPIPFFAAGILFRIPWFTRKLGGLLIALSLGVYIILPLIYTLGWYTIDKTSVTVTVTPLVDDSSLLGIPSVGSLMPFETPDTSVLFTNYTCVEQASYGCARYTENSVGLLDIAGRTFIATLAIPLIAIFTTIGFVRQFSPMIGGDAEIAGLTRMI